MLDTLELFSSQHLHQIASQHVTQTLQDVSFLHQRPNKPPPASHNRNANDLAAAYIPLFYGQGERVMSSANDSAKFLMTRTLLGANLEITVTAIPPAATPSSTTTKINAQGHVAGPPELTLDEGATPIADTEPSSPEEDTFDRYVTPSEERSATGSVGRCSSVDEEHSNNEPLSLPKQTTKLLLLSKTNPRGEWCSDHIYELFNLNNTSSTNPHLYSVKTRMLHPITGDEIVVADVIRRYSDFDDLDMRVHSLFTRFDDACSKDALKFADSVSLPQPPPKYMRSVTNHSTPHFISTRRDQLEKYLTSLVCLKSRHGPTVRTSPDLYSFLGFSFLTAVNIQL